MTYSKKDFAKDLKTQLDLGYEPKRIGSWAHKMYLQHCGKIDRELEEVMVDLFVLEEGPEFERSESNLRELVKSLQDLQTAAVYVGSDELKMSLHERAQMIESEDVSEEHRRRKNERQINWKLFSKELKNDKR